MTTPYEWLCTEPVPAPARPPLGDEFVQAVLADGGQATYWYENGVTIMFGTGEPSPLAIRLQTDV